MAITDNPIVGSPSLQLLTPRITSYLDDKAKIWVKSGLSSASIPEQIGLMSGYKTITTDLNCGGYCDLWNKQIAIVEPKIQVVLHELSHTFQVDLGEYEKLSNLFSDQLKLEQQCETMAKYMYQRITSKPGDELFTAYFDKDSLDFLRNWYKGTVIEADI
jgi:hypothetical protein